MPLVTDGTAASPARDEVTSAGIRRGRYKIFLGMAAGVGKTYRMLQEAQAEAEAAVHLAATLVHWFDSGAVRRA